MPWWAVPVAIAVVRYLLSGETKTPPRAANDSPSTGNWDYVFDPQYNPHNT